MENWKDIPGFEGIYQVSDHGRVKSFHRKKERILKAGTLTAGYKIVSLKLKGKSIMRTVHSLVAEAFLGHKRNGAVMTVDHIDYDRTNNHVSNLRIVCGRKNCSETRSEKSSKYIGVHWHKRTRRWRSVIRHSGKYHHLGSFKCEHEAGKAYQKELKRYKDGLV